MRLVREGRLVEDDYVAVADDAPLPPEGDVIVSLARWQRERADLEARPGRVGIVVPGDARVEEFGATLEALSLVAITLPTFVDGRAYSVARLLRTRYGYRGELRAVGNVLRDQLQYLARCGFDSFEIDPTKVPERVLSGLSDFSVAYQPAADERQPLWRRHARPWPTRS